MDLDSFSAVRESRWARLRQLARQRRLTGAEADEFARLYQGVATDLSQVRSAAPDPHLIMRLSSLMAEARLSLTGAREPAWKSVVRFLAHGLPAALFRLRWWTQGVTAGFLIVAVISAMHGYANIDEVGTPEARAEYANEQFAYYYEEYPSTSFFALVWSNNSRIEVLSVAFGLTGFVPAWLQFQNATAVGSAAAVMYEQDQLDLFFQLIIPHGLIELTSIWLAGAAGLKMFWVMLVPGPRPRLRALAEEGRGLVGVALGLVLLTTLAGMIEGYVTGSALPWLLKDGIGVTVLAGYWWFVWSVGGRAVRAGETGDVSADDREDFAATVG